MMNVVGRKLRLFCKFDGGGSVAVRLCAGVRCVRVQVCACVVEGEPGDDDKARLPLAPSLPEEARSIKPPTLFIAGHVTYTYIRLAMNLCYVKIRPFTRDKARDVGFPAARTCRNKLCGCCACGNHSLFHNSEPFSNS